MADVRALRETANAALAAGKFKRALVAYQELEQLEPRDAQWPKRLAETLRRLGKEREAIEAYERSAERYAQSGFLVQAMAVCKIILQIVPQHEGSLRRLADMNAQLGHGPTRAAGLAENNPNLHEDANIAAIRRGHTEVMSTIPGTIPPPMGQTMQIPRTLTPRSIQPRAPETISVEMVPAFNPSRRNKTQTTNPPISIARTKSRPVQLGPNAALDSINLSREIRLSFPSHEQPGMHVIPLDEELELIADDEVEFEDESPSAIRIEVDAADDPIEPEVVESTELELADFEDIPLPEPRALALAAQRTLAATPLFAGLPSAALEALVEELQLISVEPGEVVFREGDPGDALYVIAEGEVSVQAEGPPRVEMARMGPGTFLGEVALMTDQPRSATVIGVTAAELLRIDRGTLSRVLANHGDMLPAVLRFVRDRLIDRWMRTSPIFRPFSDDERAALAGKFRFLEIDPGTRVLTVGQRPDGLYIVLAGKLVVSRDDAPIAQLGPGDLIGETALLSGGAFKSDVTAHHKTLALCLPAKDFREMIMTHPHVLEYVGEQAEHSRRLQIL